MSISRSVRVRAGGIPGLVLLLAGCTTTGAPAAGIAQPSAARALTALATAAVSAPAGINLPAGQRAAAAIDARGVAWILSQRFQAGDLVLFRVALASGQVIAIQIDGSPSGALGGGMAVDASGNVWMTHAQAVYRSSRDGATVNRWTLPAPPPDASPSDANPGLGEADAAAWDPVTSELLFVRNGDHRLYAFDAAAASVSSSADLGVLTTYHSRIALDATGSISVTGEGLGATPFNPRRVQLALPTAFPVQVDEALTTCSAPGQGPIALDASGRVSGLGPSGASAKLPFVPHADTPLACGDDGSAYTYSVAAGAVSVLRASPRAEVTTARVDLVPIQVRPHFGNPSPTAAWLDPLLAGILPDPNGGAWLLAGIGTVPGDAPPSFPSLRFVAP